MKQNIFIFEHICGGGMIDQELPGDLIAQGGAILCAAIEDFQSAGHCVSTTLDHRVGLSFDRVAVSAISTADQLDPSFDQLARQADATLVIAPEFDRWLQRWLLRLESLNVRSLGCESQAAAKCGDKMQLAQILEQAGVPTPAVFPLDWSQDVRLPAVVKPRYGAGCEDTYVCRDRNSLQEVAQRYAGVPEQWIIQPLCDGLPGVPTVQSPSTAHGAPVRAQYLVSSANSPNHAAAGEQVKLDSQNHLCGCPGAMAHP